MEIKLGLLSCPVSVKMSVKLGTVDLSSIGSVSGTGTDSLIGVDAELISLVSVDA